MKNDKPRGSALRSARLPAMLLVVLLASISGVVLWLTLKAPPAEKAAAPNAAIEFGPKEKPKAATLASGPASGPASSPASTAPDPGPPETAASDKAGNKDPAKPGPIAPDHAAKPPPERATHTAAPAPAAAASVAPKTDMTKASPPPAPVPDKPAAESRPPAHKEAMAAKKTAPVAPDDPTMAPPLVSVIPKLPRPPPSAPLPQAPDPALIEATKAGPLPIVGRDGREPWRVYGRPFNRADKRPKISVVLYGLGSSAAATQTAIQGLPGAISLAFSPYADGLRNSIANARAAGHEALLMVPMEPRNFPQNDPGPQALLTSLTNKQNISRLEWILGRAVGYVGVTDFMGSRFTNSTPHMESFFKNLKLRGLMYLESITQSRITAGEIARANRVPFAPNSLYIDSQASRAAIDAQLVEAERLARKLGEVVVMGFLYPVTLERVANWAKTIEKRGLVLAPVSALAKRR